MCFLTLNGNTYLMKSYLKNQSQFNLDFKNHKKPKNANRNKVEKKTFLKNSNRLKSFTTCTGP